MISHTALYLLHDMSEDNEILFSVFDYWGSRESWTLEVKYTTLTCCVNIGLFYVDIALITLHCEY